METTALNKKSLIEILHANGSQIRAFGVVGLSIFGSSVKDNLKPESDIDLLVDFAAGQKKYDNFMELGFFLESLLGRRIELVTRESLSKYIGSYILKEAENVAI
jgi:uncharacterized protein